MEREEYKSLNFTATPAGGGGGGTVTHAHIPKVAPSSTNCFFQKYMPKLFPISFYFFLFPFFSPSFLLAADVVPMYPEPSNNIKLLRMPIRHLTTRHPHQQCNVLILRTAAGFGRFFSFPALSSIVNRQSSIRSIRSIIHDDHACCSLQPFFSFISLQK